MKIFRLLTSKNRGCLFILLAVFVFSSVSCVTNRQAIYIQPGKEQKVDFEVVIKEPRKIQPGDELYITVGTEDVEENVFTTISSNRMALNDVTLISYTVNEKGYIRFPVIKYIKLGGLTLDEAENAMEKALTGFIGTPSVTVKFVNKNVTLLGFVNNPGRYQFPDTRINIFQALGYAGDISTYGNRKKIMLVREENNIITRRYLDLTDENLLTSDYYYIKPNDVIYVEPLKRRHLGMDTFPYGLVLSIISTTILVLSYLNIYQ